MKRFFSLILFISCVLLLLLNSVCIAAVTLPWSTTYDCNDWSYGGALSCDGLSEAGGWSACGNVEQITIAANNSNGGGGKGQRHWVGDGTNQNSGGLQLTFTQPPSEIWMRWYIRYEAGFSWSRINYDKIIYFYLHPRSSDIEVISELYGWDGYRQALQGKSGVISPVTNWGGWETIMGSQVSDGQWHYFEVHMKMDTNGSNGISEVWIDNTLVISRNDVDYGGLSHGVTGIETLVIGSNQETVANGNCMAIDFDDIAISGTGKIGPIGGGGSQDTTPPTVNMTQPTQGQTISGTATISANAQDNIAIADVQFQVDGQNSGGQVFQAPFQYTLDTQSLADGTHTVSAVATDTSGNQTISNSINFTVNNSGGGGGGGAATTLFTESFEDSDFVSRSWYDNTNLHLSTTEHIAGSTSSVEFHFLQGATTPTSGTSIRKKFLESDEVYVSYYVKYSANWEGSNKSYHPHEFYILTNKNHDWKGPAYSRLTAYIEQNEGQPLLVIQDSENIDETQVGVDLTGSTENRAVAGCNGDSDGYGNGICYSVGSVHRNGKDWRTGNIYFQDTPGSYYKNDWHHVEAYFKLNSISGGQAVADGQLKYWFDGNLIIDHNDVVIRTGQNYDMKFNQFLIGPWIGDGSPVDQTMWVDNLTVGTSRTVTATIQPPAQFQIVP